MLCWSTPHDYSWGNYREVMQLLIIGSHMQWCQCTVQLNSVHLQLISDCRRPQVYGVRQGLCLFRFYCVNIFVGQRNQANVCKKQETWPWTCQTLLYNQAFISLFMLSCTHPTCFLLWSHDLAYTYIYIYIFFFFKLWILNGSVYC